MPETVNHPGQFIKPCPCSPQTVSCGYTNINLHTGCPFDCSYCILQLYLPDKRPVFFGNTDQAAAELRRLARTQPALRIGSGELADSLADPQTDRLVPFLFDLLTDLPEVVFELKTKSARIQSLLERPPLSNLVVAWSLNPKEIIDREEAGTASLHQRLLAIQALIAHGYKVAVHFDPLILTPDWPSLYRDLVERLLDVLPESRLAWWSLGALRFPAGLRRHIFAHRESRLFDGELIRGYDEKYRYLRPLRQELFLTLRSFIQARLGGIAPLYLCMEDRAMWGSVFPELPPDSEAINYRLYRRVVSGPTTS